MCVGCVTSKLMPKCEWEIGKRKKQKTNSMQNKQRKEGRKKKEIESTSHITI